MKSYLKLLNGPNTIGNSKLSWIVFGVVMVLGLTYPIFGSRFMVSNIALFVLYLPIALGLSILWGYLGVLSFGQMAFFGISGYCYGILATNLQHLAGGTVLSLFLSLIATGLVAAFFGYFVFYGQVSGWIIPVLTLVLTLVMETFMGQTAGYQWKIGNCLLGGYNGMTNIPSLKIGSFEFGSVNPSLYYLVFVSCLLLYLGLRILANSKWGAIIVAVREDTERTRMVGHNVNLIQVLVFSLSAVLAGLSGIFYVSWGNYIDPSTMGMISATLPVVWVCVGGKESLLAVLMSTVLLGYLSDLLSVYGGQFAFLVNGALLLTVMLFFPDGIFLSLARNLKKRRSRPPIVEKAVKHTLPVLPPKPKQISQFRSRFILEASDLSKAFGGVQAVNHLSFNMKRGELRTLIGPNGAGKSTFFNLLSGLHRADSGVIRFNDSDITRLPPFLRIRSGLSLKFQTNRTYKNLTVAENLQIPRTNTGLNGTYAQHLTWALRFFELDDCLDHVVAALDHGHRQWLEICLSLATDPNLLLLDEPTTGMTPEETAKTAEFVKELNKSGFSILIVEHDMTFVRQLECPVTVLHRGSIFAEGSLAEIESNTEVRRIYLGDRSD